MTTHLLGGSARREGTAVQMGGSIAEYLGHWLHISKSNRNFFIICGIRRSFNAVFGSPLASTIFALPDPVIRSFADLTVLILLIFFVNNRSYLGLSLPLLNQAFAGDAKPFDFLGKLIFIVFTDVTNAPISCFIMGIQLFGSQNIVYLFLICVISYLFSDNSGISFSQRRDIKKSRTRLQT